MYCVYPNCDTNRIKNPELSFHGFPKDAEKLQKWLDAVNMVELPVAKTKKGYGICSRHIDKDFIRTSTVRKHLSPDAVPHTVSIYLHLMLEYSMPCG